MFVVKREHAPERLTLFRFLSVAGYFARNKDCVPQIEAGEPCLEDDVCIDDAQCSGSPRGACTCNEGFYQDGRTCRKKASVGLDKRAGVLLVLLL